MRLGILVVGGLLLGASFTAQLAGVGAWGDVISWIQGFGVGLLGGMGAAVLGEARRRDEDPPPAPPAPSNGLIHASGRHRIQGNALDASLDPDLGSTISAENQPLRGVVALPGLAQSARQTRQAGASGYLHVFTGHNKGESLVLGDQPITLGRDPKNALVLKDEGISQVHAEVRLEGTRLHIRDLGSKNGTFVNDERVVSRMLEPGDVVGLGGATKILFQAA